MGTAFLLPQDCLPSSKNRHKSHLSEAIYHAERASRIRRGTPKVSPVKELSTTCPDNFRRSTPTSRVEWTVKSSALPPRSHGAYPMQANELQEEVDSKKNVVRKPTGVREARSNIKSAADGPVFTILQRPKCNEAANELIVKFLVKLEEEKDLDGEHARMSNGSKAQSVGVDGVRPLPIDKPKPQANNHSKLSETKLLGSKCRKGVCNVNYEEPKAVNTILLAPKLVEMKSEGYTVAKGFAAEKGHGQSEAACVAVPMNVERRESQSLADGGMNLKGLSKLASLKKVGSASMDTLRSKQSQQVMLGSMIPSGLSKLKRATTDPQIVKQLVGHCRSETVNIPFSEAKSCHGFTKSTSMSCPERWAGPSYFSSPAPSSLPLPKFSLSNQKMSSLQSSVVEVHLTNIPLVPDMESPSPIPSPPQGGYVDVVFATRSLRRMLKLDPF